MSLITRALSSHPTRRRYSPSSVEGVCAFKAVQLAFSFASHLGCFIMHSSVHLLMHWVVKSIQVFHILLFSVIIFLVLESFLVTIWGIW